MLKVNDLHKYFGKLEVLKGITTEIHKGEVVAIIGASGSGKSTFLRCLNLLEEPTKGEVIFEGQNLTTREDKNFNINKVREHIGMVFQHFNLFSNLSVIDNITLAPIKVKGMGKQDAEAKAIELLKRVGLEDKKDVYPSTLSGGQKQRVAIARALATSPEMLLCDEPTSALDPLTTKAMLALLQDINRKLGVTILIITHELAVVQAICSRVAVISDGRVAEIGEVAQVFTSPRSAETKRLLGREG